MTGASSEAALPRRQARLGVAGAKGAETAATVSAKELRERLEGRSLVLIDGPAGSGKTTLAAGFDAPVVHLDDLYAGWTGMQEGLDRAQAMVDALRDGRPAGYHRYDWHRGEYAEWVPVPPADLLVIEGCGAGSLQAGDALLIWIDADVGERLRRGLARDGEAFRENWLRWQEAERALFERDRTAERAEVRLRT